MFNRRQFIQAGAVSAGAIIAGSSMEVLAKSSSERAPDLRIAHLTDMHVMPDGAMGVNAESRADHGGKRHEQSQTCRHRHVLPNNGGAQFFPFERERIQSFSTSCNSQKLVEGQR